MPDVRVCSVADVKSGAAARFDVDGHRLCVVNIEGTFYVVGDECSHEDYSLAEGDVWEDERTIECPKHGSTFDLNTGSTRTLPATQPVEVFATKIEHDDVLIEVPEES